MPDPEPAKGPRRRITLLDLMILVAATALGLWALRVLNEYEAVREREYYILSLQYGSSFGSKFPRAMYYNAEVYLLLISWILGLLIIRLRGPRSYRPRVILHPDMALYLAGLPSLFFLALLPVFFVKHRRSTGSFGSNFSLVIMGMCSVLFLFLQALPILWGVLYLVGRRRKARPRPPWDWIDYTAYGLAAVTYPLTVLPWLNPEGLDPW